MKHFLDSKQEQLFLDFLKSKNCFLSNKQIDLLFQYADCVIRGNESTNLISKNDALKFYSRHLTDSLIPFCFLKEYFSNLNSNTKWADMGSGGGCPVFPLAIALPNIHFFAVEPRNKRVQFLQETKNILKLDNLEVVGKRFETSGLEGLDFISCRALSTFENDWERAKLALKKNGIFLTLKSFETISHLEKDSSVCIQKYSLPEEDKQYALVYKRFQ